MEKKNEKGVLQNAMSTAIFCAKMLWYTRRINQETRRKAREWGWDMKRVEENIKRLTR